ncbi:alkanesulfonate monooxygenase SsuD/methylene tetrahydromethanopterin reductase-like flavin-dependent oxidoreductase (luciferase family) [Lipingzhangella halophila]|uniref:Alkanesulfonate monooxygenase SsuD/methylene tetrahydromethanopterin reductase-like flavin-dependent oxidoreductase (Luciferase family) n=1 Tax=Lipingzhangella halophila TaxID=1783352 RepID=A0A7W7RLN0_9ACTN|nr:LLM class flavin-dependent oxidoreductase [Lipingzhangella halophila]MBB4934087.1 alkanesulfonate monooxygenase SsuD/methylene tetrahydromethanopterin reductase-like flavin-dependent oxidoreductase (luciferase family) [Lipingzhangella halophila]
MPTVSVLIPRVPRRPEQVLPYAALVEWTHACRLWQGQALLVEPHQAFAYAAGAGFRVPVGLGVTLMGLRHPYEAASQIRSLAMITGHPVVAGFGPGSRDFQRTLRSEPYASPLTAAREYLTAVRQGIDGRIGDVEGDYVTFRGQLAPTPAPDVSLGLGVLRPGMARLAGEIADVAITWLTPAPYLDEVIRPALREGAEKAGRPTPRLVSIVPMAVAAVDRDPAELAHVSNAQHVAGPHYRDMLQRAGSGISAQDTPHVAAKRLVECGAFLSGTPDELVGAIAGFGDAGVDEVVVNVTGVHKALGHKAAMDDLKAILRATA